MRLSHSLVFAAALSAAVPAVSQTNAAAPDNAAAMNAAATPTGNAMSTAAPAADQSGGPVGTVIAPARRGFPWGVFGLLGLIGLFGVRKVKG